MIIYCIFTRQLIIIAKYYYTKYFITAGFTEVT
jgi:hypothetical protein